MSKEDKDILKLFDLVLESLKGLYIDNYPTSNTLPYDIKKLEEELSYLDKKQLEEK